MRVAYGFRVIGTRLLSHEAAVDLQLPLSYMPEQLRASQASISYGALAVPKTHVSNVE